MTDSRRTPTIAEVARLAGVSPATVSRVMNSRFVGGPDVAERVRQAAAELDYRPSPLARSLALGVTRTIAFVVPDLANPAFQAVLSSITKAAARDGYRVLVADSAESPDTEAVLAVETRRMCDSIVLCAPRMSEESLTGLAPSLRPLVLINRPTADVEAPSLSVDYAAGIRSLAEHLHRLGHRDLVYLQGPATSVSDARRLAGLALFQAEEPGTRVRILPGGASSDDGRAAAARVIESGATAVLAFNDLAAVGLVAGLAEAGVSVPRDVSVTGFDDIPFARYVSPALTTAAVDYAELGILAWPRLLAAIRGEERLPDVVLQPRMMPRASTAAAR